MSWKYIIKTRAFQFFPPVFFFFLYFLFPTQNSTIDAYGYASYIKNGENLFLPHHLLYNAIGFIWVKFISIFLSVSSILGLLKVLNTLFAASSIWLMVCIFRKLGFDGIKAFVWASFVGSTWSVMRFATENETYLAPILFSLLGSYFFLVYLDKNKLRFLIVSGTFTAIACLVHQLHFWWWIALLVVLIGRDGLKKSFFYFIPSFVVPFAYVLVLVFYQKNSLTVGSLIEFVLRDFHSGAATVSFGLKSILFAGISFIRTFVQIHGYIIYVVKAAPWILFAAVLMAMFLGVAVYQLRKVSFSWSKLFSPYIFAHLLGFVLHLLFAFLSHGNAEFMVVLPFLLAIPLSLLMKDEVHLILLITIAMLVWNFFFGIYPLNRFELDGNKMVANHIIEQNKIGDEHYYILFNKPAVENRVRYYSGAFPANVASATQDVQPNEIRGKISNALEHDKVVLTDCLFRSKTISRESLTKEMHSDVFLGFTFTKVDSISTISGTYFLVELKKE